MTLEFPIIYLLPTHLDLESLPELESQIPSLTYDINEAEIILGKISKPERARFELRRHKLQTKAISLPTSDEVRPPKRQRISPSVSAERLVGSDISSSADHELSTARESGNLDDPQRLGRYGIRQAAPSPRLPVHTESSNLVKVVKLDWLLESIKQGQVLPIDRFLVYQGVKTKPSSRSSTLGRLEILKRAREDAIDAATPSKATPSVIHAAAFDLSPKPPITSRPALNKETTSEHDLGEGLPPVPSFLHSTYSCQRPTPLTPPNNDFVEQIKKIRTLRALSADEIGVRAYSTVIATLAAYPYRITTAQEIARLPGCSAKSVQLWQEWNASGLIQEVENACSDPKMRVLELFCDIWGVGEITARDFYNRGWRDLDDVVEYGWDDLTRVQQIGVKYYDEFRTKIPRREVEVIGTTILQHAQRLRQGFQMVIVGGYRRGKQESGDVDVVLSHPDPEATHNFIENIVSSLEQAKFITHTLTLGMTNSERSQAPVSWKGNERKTPSGFDTLDKALVVWKHPDCNTLSHSINNQHRRRVDIIVSPWKTVGCAVIGWSGGTTFQRDLRRYCHKEKGLKFDSSGIRSRVDGSWVDLESDRDGPAPDMLTAEKRVFAGLGLEWRRPEERCTG